MLEQFFDYLDATDSGFAWLIGFGLALLVLMEFIFWLIDRTGRNTDEDPR
jgi:hypothetical protein